MRTGLYGQWLMGDANKETNDQRVLGVHMVTDSAIEMKIKQKNTTIRVGMKYTMMNEQLIIQNE